MPVLPAVPSTMRPPGSMTPRRSPSSTMYLAARSLTEPPGFANSAFPRIVQPVSSEACRSLISGVLPTASTKSVRMSIRSCEELLDGDRDLLGAHRRLVGNMQRVAEHELQRVLTGRKRKLRFGLTEAEVPMIRVVRDRQVVRRQRFDVDEQMVMPRVRRRDTGGRDAHAAQAEANRDRRADGRA